MATDARVDAAISHWGPRFIANGVPYPDFREVTAGLDRWEDWCRAWSERAATHRALGDEALAAGHGRTAGEHHARAAVEYHFAKFLFVDDPAQMRAAHAQAVACHVAALPHLDPPGQRVEIPFGEHRLAGVLRLPADRGRAPAPVVVMVMGLDSAKEEMGTNEQHFLDRGMATLTFDGPGQGEAEYELTIRPDYEVPVAAVVDWVAIHPELDGSRVGLWGVSLGGYYAPRAAAFETRVRACVSLSGPYDLGAAWDGLPALTRRAFQVRAGAADEDEAHRRAATLTLEGAAPGIRCPLLVVAGGRDPLFGVEHARRLVGEASGPSELLLVEEGNHVVSNRPYRYRSQTADWMADRLGVEAVAGR